MNIVISGAAINDVVTFFAINSIIATAAINDIVVTDITSIIGGLSTAIDPVGTITTIQHIRTVAA